MKTKQNTIKEIRDSVVTRENIREIVGLLTMEQLNFLNNLFQLPERIGFAKTQAEGGITASLRKRGLIQPVGRVGIHVRWQPIETLFQREERELIKQIVNSKEKS